MKLFKSSINDKLVGDVFDRYKVLKELFHNNVKVLDIGANIGQTIYEISLNFNSSVIHSFEPQKISLAVNRLNLKHVVITSVDRDDLKDGGSNHFYNVITATKRKNPNTTVEVLTPDFLSKGDADKKVIEANPDVFNHNIETVPSLYRKVSPGARYFSSLDLLKKTKEINSNIFTKSGIMVGLGESKDEILQVMDDLISAKVDFLTIGQYLQPSPKHFPLEKYYHPDEFKELGEIAKSKGFLLVSSTPLTRSSYHADEDFRKLKTQRLKINASGLSKKIN